MKLHTPTVLGAFFLALCLSDPVAADDGADRRIILPPPLPSAKSQPMGTVGNLVRPGDPGFGRSDAAGNPPGQPRPGWVGPVARPGDRGFDPPPAGAAQVKSGPEREDEPLKSFRNPVGGSSKARSVTLDEVGPLDHFEPGGVPGSGGEARRKNTKNTEQKQEAHRAPPPRQPDNDLGIVDPFAAIADSVGGPSGHGETFSGNSDFDHIPRPERSQPARSNQAGQTDTR